MKRVSVLGTALCFLGLMFVAGSQPVLAGVNESSEQARQQLLSEKGQDGERTVPVEQATSDFDQFGWPARGHFDPFPDATRNYVDFNRNLWDELGLLYAFIPTFMVQAGTQRTNNLTANYQHQAVLLWQAYNDTPIGTGYFHFQSLYVTQLTDVTGVDFAGGLGINFFTSDSVANVDVIKALLWRHEFPGDVFSFSLGHVEITDIDGGGCSYTCDDTGSFVAAPLSTNVARTLPGQGAGFLAEWQVMENVYLEGGVADARGDGTIDFGRAFRSGEYAAAGALKLVDPFPDLGGGFYKFSYYYVTPTREGTPQAMAQSEGVQINIEQDIGEVGLFAKYVRAFGRKGQVRQSAAGGAVWKNPFGNDEDWLGAAFGWVDPTASNTKDEYVAETFYRAQLTPFVQVSPVAQLIINSSRNPSDLEAVFTFRARGFF